MVFYITMCEAWITPTLLPDISAPDAFTAIVNGHFKVDAPAGAPKLVGVIGGTAQWLFAFEGRISTTISGADAVVDTPRQEMAEALWADVAKVYGLGPELPTWQIVKERRATFAATPAQLLRRPPARGLRSADGTRSARSPPKLSELTSPNATSSASASSTWDRN